MGKNWHFASYSLWSLFSPAVGQEQWHCDLKRGYLKAKKKQPEVAALLNQDTSVQSIGLLGQQGVYEFHQDLKLLDSPQGVQTVAAILELEKYSEPVQQRVTQILHNYQNQPILLGKDLLKLNRGDEGIPAPIEIEQNGETFKLYAALDCIFRQEDGIIHILDLKTGKSASDRRQALVYLLLISYLYPEQPACASFYNLESQQSSEIITASLAQLQSVQLELSRLAKQHQKQLGQYRKNPEKFTDIYPPSPGKPCTYCQFKSICPFSLTSICA